MTSLPPKVSTVRFTVLYTGSDLGVGSMGSRKEGRFLLGETGLSGVTGGRFPGGGKAGSFLQDRR